MPPSDAKAAHAIPEQIGPTAKGTTEGIHALLFAVWMLALERSPWPTLTLVVSLEAIFLSTFVMIGQTTPPWWQH